MPILRHPKFESTFYDVPQENMEAWLSQGWLAINEDSAPDMGADFVSAESAQVKPEAVRAARKGRAQTNKEEG